MKRRGVVEEKGKRVSLRTREAMDFDPKPRVQKEVDEYLMMYNVRLPSNVEVEWGPAKTDVTASPPTDGVYFHAQILTLG